jgi:hypothetical protein
MILHIVLYRFRADAQEEQIQQCIQELKATIKTTELVSWYLSGSHIALPADTPVRDMVYDFASLWGFVDLKTLDKFSRHPAVAYCEATYIRPVVEKLAIININETTDTSWGVFGNEEKMYVS